LGLWSLRAKGERIIESSIIKYRIIKKKRKRSGWEAGEKMSKAVRRVKHVSEVVFG
jgi:hypothetical protein